MEPIGLALASQPLNFTAILLLILVALAVFFVAYRARDLDEDGD